MWSQLEVQQAYLIVWPMSWAMLIPMKGDEL